MGDPQEIIRRAWEAASAVDLQSLERVLAPNARWLPVWEDAPGCQCRTEIIGFIRQSQGRVLRGEIEESTPYGSRVVVGFRPERVPVDRPLDEGLAYVVVTVDGSAITEIKGCATRDVAEAYARS